MARKRKIIEISSPTVTYEGVASPEASTSDPSWQVKRIAMIGSSITLEEYAANGEFDQVWDNRVNLFQGVPFVNTHSIQFDGVNDRIDVAHNASLDFSRTSPFTLSLWVKSPNTATKNYLEKMASSIGYRFYDSGGNKIQLEFRGTGGTGDRIRVETSSATSVNDGNWHNVVVTYSGSGAASGVRIYLDGQQLGTTTLSDTLTTNPNNSGTLSIASRSGGGTNFVGNIDEVSIWDAALNATEVDEIYNDRFASDLSQHSNGSIVSWWSFNDVNYPTVPDNVGSHNGSMINMTPGDVETEIPHG